MESNNASGDWIATIAKKANVDINKVEDVLARNRFNHTNQLYRKPAEFPPPVN